jgi:hypothetical protein
MKIVPYFSSRRTLRTRMENINFWMKPILIITLLFAAVITVHAQPRTLRSTKIITEKSVVKYTTASGCTIVFLKGELLNAYSHATTTSWFKMKFPEERKAALRAVALLKKEGPLTLKANDAHASADEKELASLIEEKLGAGPFLIGTIDVFDKENHRQDTIEVVNYYNFYLRNSKNPFFVIRNN